MMELESDNIKSIGKNSVMNATLTASSLAFSVVIFPYVSRVLTPIGTGKVSFATSFISYFSMLAQLGIPTYGIRACAKVRDNKEKLTRVVHELLIINLVMTLFSYVGLYIAVTFVDKLKNEKPLYLLVSSTIFLTSIGVEWLYKALEQYTYITVRSIIFKIISLIMIFMLIHSKEDYFIYGAITIFASSASNILNFINIRKFIYLKNVGNYNFGRHIKAVFVFFAMACATTIYTNLDTVMLGFMRTDADVGYYNAAVKIKNVLVGVVTSVGAVLLPRVSYYIEHGGIDEFRKVANKALKFVLFAAIPTSMYFLLYAREGILFLSGSAYEPAILPMQVIMPTVILIGITNILGIQMLVPLGREKHVLYSEIIGAIMDLILNAFFIPLYGALGAAIGTLVAELAVFLFQFNAIRDERKYISANRNVILYILIAGVSGVVCLWVKMFEMPVFFALCLSSVSFFGCYLIILFFLRDEMIQTVFHKR